MPKQTESRGGDRVSIDEDMHQLYRDLTEKCNEDPEGSPFLLMKDLFMWAVALGVKAEKRMPLKKREAIFRWDQFSQYSDIPVLQAIAISETNGVDVLLDQSQIIRIAEEYANMGINVIKSEMCNQPGQPLWNLVNMIRNHANHTPNNN
jgi:dnd system-associated protein 4